MYGVCSIALKWIKSYLSDRSQKVVIQRDIEVYYSESRKISVGIPQGSITGPLLFVIYINDLASSINNTNGDIGIVNYADDTNLIVDSELYPDLLKKCSDTLNNATRWFTENKLVLNQEKTNLVLFKSNHAGFETPHYAQINNKKSELTTSTKFLGVFIDDTLSWFEEVEYISSKLNRSLYSLRVLKRYIHFDCLKMVYYSNFQSTLRFGIIFWGNSISVDRIFIIQKRTVRLLLNLDYNETCRGRFKQLNILTVVGLYIHECLLFLFKNKQLFDVHRIEHEYDTRSIGYKMPNHRLTLSERNAGYSCVKFFNKLPNILKEENSFKLFKSKTFQFLLNIEPYSVAEYMSHICI